MVISKRNDLYISEYTQTKKVQSANLAGWFETQQSNVKTQQTGATNTHNW